METAAVLFHDFADVAGEGYHSFDALWNEVVFVVEAIALAATGARFHGVETAHAAVDHKCAAFVEDFFAGALFGAGEGGAHHDAVGSGDEGFCNVTGVANTAVGDDGDVSLEGAGGGVDGGDLGDANSCDDAGGADGAGTNTDFYGVGSGIAEGDGGFAGGDVAADDVDFRKFTFDPADHFDDALAVSVGGVNDENVDFFFGENFRAFVVAGADTGGDAEAVVGVAVEEGFFVFDETANVGEGVEPDEFSVFDER